MTGTDRYVLDLFGKQIKGNSGFFAATILETPSADNSCWTLSAAAGYRLIHWHPNALVDCLIVVGQLFFSNFSWLICFTKLESRPMTVYVLTALMSLIIVFFSRFQFTLTDTNTVKSSTVWYIHYYSQTWLSNSKSQVCSASLSWIFLSSKSIPLSASRSCIFVQQWIDENDTTIWCV